MQGDDISYIVLGHIDDSDAIANGIIKVYPKSRPNIPSLYSDTLQAVMGVTTKYFCILDGGEDRLMPGFDSSIKYRIGKMAERGLVIGYADEYVGDRIVVSGEFSQLAFKARPTMLHHGIVCCTKTAQSISWPKASPTAHYIFGVMLYGTLGQLGFVYHRVPVYKWNPTPNGARCWPGVSNAINNSVDWAANQWRMNESIYNSSSNSTSV
jgi:hypothetical protein